jgi:hypothetical protein
MEELILAAAAAVVVGCQLVAMVEMVAQVL